MPGGNLRWQPTSWLSTQFCSLRSQLMGSYAERIRVHPSLCGKVLTIFAITLNAFQLFAIYCIQGFFGIASQCLDFFSFASLHGSTEIGIVHLARLSSAVVLCAAIFQREYTLHIFFLSFAYVCGLAERKKKPRRGAWALEVLDRLSLNPEEHQESYGDYAAKPHDIWQVAADQAAQEQADEE